MNLCKICKGAGWNTIMQALSRASIARANCEQVRRDVSERVWARRLKELSAMLPHGSGFDAGCELIQASDTRVVFKADFHHMDENGYYDGWTEHTVIATANFTGFTLRVTGRDRNDIKEYIAMAFYSILQREAPDFNYGEYHKEEKRK